MDSLNRVQASTLQWNMRHGADGASGLITHSVLSPFTACINALKTWTSEVHWLGNKDMLPTGF